MSDKPKFNPNKPYKEFSVAEISEKPSFNPNKPYKEVYGEVGLLNEVEPPKPKFDEVIAGIQTDNDNEKLMLKNLALKVNEGKAKHEDLTEAILTIQGQHKNQGGKKNYYVDNIDGVAIPKPLAINEKAPKNITDVFNETSWYEDLGNSVLRGSEKLGSALAKTPAFINDIAAIPLNAIADMTAVPLDPTGKLGLEPTFSSKKLAEGFGLPENKVAQYYDEQAKINQENFNQKYDKGITDYVKNGEYGKAFGLLGNSIAESAPTTIGLAVANAGGVGAIQSILGGGAVFGAQKKGELDEQAPDMNEQAKINVALSNGLFEGIFEQFGITKLGGITKDAFLKDGKEAAYKLALDGFKETYRPVVTKYLGTSAEESLSEAATQFAQNAVDKFSGYKPDMNLADGVVDAALVGFGAGAGYGLLAGKTTEELQKQKINKANEQSKAIFDIVKQGNDAVVGFKSEIFNGVKNGKLTQAEADKAITKINAFKDYNDMLGSLELNDQNKRELFDLSFQKQALETELGGIKDPTKLNPIEQAQYNVKEKFASDLQKQINEIVLKAQINDETVVAKKTVDDVVKLENPVKKEGETKPKLSPVQQALIDKYKKEASKKEKPEDKRTYEEIPMTEFNSGKLNARDLHKKTVAYLEKQPNKTLLGNIVEKQFISPQGKANKTYGVQLPDGKVMKFSSSMEREEGFRGHMRTEHLVDKEDLVGFPIGLKVEEIPSFEEGDKPKKVIKAFNANTGKFVGYMKETNTGKKQEYNQKQIDYLEHLGTISENPIVPPTEDEGGITIPVKPKPMQPKGSGSVKVPTKDEFVAQNIEALKNDPDADYDEYLDESGLYTNAFSEQYEKQYGKDTSRETKSESRKDTGTGNESNRTRKGKKGTPKARRKIKDPRYKKALQVEPNTAHELVLQYFIGGGKINPSAIRELYKSAGKEIQARLNYLNKNAPTIEGVAHYLWQNQDFQRWDDVDIKNEVENVVNGYVHPTAMAEALLEAHNEKLDAREQAMANVMEDAEKAEVKNEVEDIIDNIESLPDNELEKGIDIILRPDIKEGEEPFAKKRKSDKRGEDISKVVERIQKSLPKVKVVMDESLDAKGKWSPKTKTLTINPYYATKDTPIHEAGHILIDAMGGTNNRVIKAAIKQLEGTPLWEETAKLYPITEDYTIDDLGKEVLAEAIGREGAGIFDSKVEESKFKTYLSYIFDWLKRNLGLEKNIAKNLAKQIISGVGTKKLADGKTAYAKPKELEYAEGELKKAERELKASKSAFDIKRKELGKEINNDQEDLFGERKSTESAGLFDERVDLNAYEDIIEPFKQRYDKAVKEFTKWQNKVTELEGKEDSQTSLFQKNKKEEIDELQSDLNSIEEQIDEAEDDDTISELENVRDIILEKIEALNQEAEDFKKGIVKVEEVANAEDLKGFTLEELVEAYHDAKNYEGWADKEMLDKAKRRIAYYLNQTGKERLRALDKDIDAKANQKDLKWNDIWFSTLGHINENFPELQEFYKIFNTAFLDMQQERQKKKSELERLGKAVIAEHNKKLGIAGKAQNLFTSNSAKYFEYLDDNGKFRTNTAGLSKAQIDLLNFMKGLVKERNGQEQDIENEILKIDKGFMENWKDSSLINAIAQYMGGSNEDVEIRIGGKKTTYKDAQKAILNDAKKGLLAKATALPKLLQAAYKAKKGSEKSNYGLNYNGQLTSKFDQPRAKDKGYSKDFYNAAMQLIDDQAHVQHMGKLVPLIDSIEQFYKYLGFEQGKSFGNVLKFIEQWKSQQVYQRAGETDPILDKALQFFRRLTSMAVMGFNYGAGGINLLIGNYNSLRAEGLTNWAKGQSRLLGGKDRAGYGTINKKAADILKKYDVVQQDFDSNPKAYAGKLFDLLAFGATRFGEYQIQGTLFLGQIDDKIWDSFEKNSEGDYVLKKGADEKAIKEKMLQYKDRVSDIQGKYSTKDAYNLSRFELGKSALQFKLWIGSWLSERYGGEYIDANNVRHRGSWNLFTEQAVKELRNDWNKYNIAASWKNKQLRQNLSGAITVAALYVLTHADSDDEKKRKQAFSLDNALQQVLFVYDPQQAKYLLESPVASVGMMKNFIDALDLALHGEGAKAGKKALKVVPYNKGITKAVELTK